MLRNLYDSKKKYGTEIVSKIDFGVYKVGLVWNTEDRCAAIGSKTNQRRALRINRAESEEIMKKFIIHWVNGTTEEITGTDISNAFMLAGYGGGALSAMDYWEETKEENYDQN